jgi:hypothetical protein
VKALSDPWAKEEATGYAIMVAVLLIAGAGGAVIALRRSQAGRGTSELDAEAEANQWLIRLDGSLIPPGATTWVTAGEAAGQALTRAAECHRVARALLVEACTTAEYERVTRTAREGLEHVREAREDGARKGGPVDPAVHTAPPLLRWRP